MVTYWVKTPQWLKRISPKQLIWDVADVEPSVYLTFDDGPHPVATPFVLGQLADAGARGTFFCVGDNVRKYEAIYDSVVAAGHTTGNHTYNHLNGWKTVNYTYLENIKKAAGLIKSNLFRPPYGKLKLSHVRQLAKEHPPWKIYMWDIISGDFDATISPEQCLDHVLSNLQPGSIVVFHDSEKAWERMSYALPRVIAYCLDKGWKLKSLPR